MKHTTTSPPLGAAWRAASKSPRPTSAFAQGWSSDDGTLGRIGVGGGARALCTLVLVLVRGRGRQVDTAWRPDNKGGPRVDWVRRSGEKEEANERDEGMLRRKKERVPEGFADGTSVRWSAGALNYSATGGQGEDGERNPE